MSYKYSRYIARVTRSPWAITPEKLHVLTELMRFRASGERLSDEEISARLGTDTERPAASARTAGAVAVIPIHGVVAHRADAFEASSGGTSTELIGRYLDRAVNDDSVTGILLDFDTPGGSVEGVPELGAKIAKATAVKPVVAHVNALAASAGYWLASQCTEIAITPSGMSGSIGVYMLTLDESEALEKEGVKINAISAGDFKLEGAWWEPLSDEARAHLQGQVDAIYRDFLAAVAKGRGVTVADVKKNYGQGRVYDAKESLKRGMVNRIATFEDTLARMVGRKSSGARALMDFGTGATAVLHGVEAVVPMKEASALASDETPVDTDALAEAIETAVVDRRISDDACTDCKGVGLKPERAMGDPQGQEACEKCGGSGKAQDADAAAADRDAVAIAAALSE